MLGSASPSSHLLRTSTSTWAFRAASSNAIPALCLAQMSNAGCIRAGIPRAIKSLRGQGQEGYTQILADSPRFPKVLTLFLPLYRFRHRLDRKVCKRDGRFHCRGQRSIDRGGGASRGHLRLRPNLSSQQASCRLAPPACRARHSLPDQRSRLTETAKVTRTDYLRSGSRRERVR